MATAMIATARTSRTYKALGLLLTYPRQELTAGLREIEDAISEEGLLSDQALDALHPLLENLSETKLLDLEETYVALFDQTRSLSLNLFEHVHGDSKERGSAMAQLQDVYSEAGLERLDELPDHLPLFCEFLSTLPAQEASGVLSETAPVLQLLAHRLAKRPSPYAAVLDALLELAGVEPEVVSDASTVAPEDLEALDRSWDESEVTFGVGDALAESPGAAAGPSAPLRPHRGTSPC
jgi:nitrate reductase delta subunit